TFLRKIDRPAALLRSRADAVRATVAGGRRRAYRSADWRQGPQSRRQRCPLPVFRIEGILSRKVIGRPGCLFRQGVGAGVEGGTVLLVDDDNVAPLPRYRRLRPAHPGSRAGLSGAFAGGGRIAGRK